MRFTRPAPAWRTSVSLPGKLAPLSAGQVESLLMRCVDNGDDQAVSRLLQTCAFNEVKLDPTVLCGCVGVCEEILDSAPCFALQDESTVQPLLAATTAEALSVERKLYAAHLAAELTVKFNLDPQPVRKVLWKHRTCSAAARLQAPDRPIAADSGTRLRPGPT